MAEAHHFPFRVGDLALVDLALTSFIITDCKVNFRVQKVWESRE